MPIYEYKCEECGHIIEKLLMLREVICACPECGKVGTLVRLISKTSFRLKGEGWADSGYSKKPKEVKDNNVY